MHISEAEAIEPGWRGRSGRYLKMTFMNILEAYRSPDIAIIALNVNDLNAPVKRQRFTQWIKKHHPVGAVISDTEYS